MAKDKNAARYDKDGVRRVMRKRDYFSDFSGQLALGLMANIVGQLNYFYTDKVGLAVGSEGIILAISKVVDAFTDVIAGNLIDHSSGGDHKYFKWIAPQIIPAAAIMVLMFTILTFITEVNSYPFDTKRMLLIEFFVIGVPTFCFALQPGKARASDRFLANIMRSSIPSALGLIVGVLFVFGVLGCFGGDQTSFAAYDNASTAAIALAAAGFACLTIISMPPNTFRLSLIAAMLGVATLALWADYYYAEMLFGDTFLNIKWTLPWQNWLWCAICAVIASVVTIVFRKLIDVIAKKHGDRIFEVFIKTTTGIKRALTPKFLRKDETR